MVSLVHFSFKQNVDAPSYLKMLQDSILPAIQAMFDGLENVLFQQDGAPGHWG